MVFPLSGMQPWGADQTPSDRLCLAAARFSTRRCFIVFCAGFLPIFLGFCEPFIVWLLTAANAASRA
jgi:hypothetical protein